MSKALTIVLVVLLGALASWSRSRSISPARGRPTTVRLPPGDDDRLRLHAVKSDTGSSADPESLWGSIDCASDSRASVVAERRRSAPDGHRRATGNDAYRRLTVLDGDDVSGERCELGRNEWSYGSEGGEGTFQLYREGERRITFASFRLPENFPTQHHPCSRTCCR